MKKLLITIALLLISVQAFGATWYVDNTASGANNGTSWVNAWTALPTSSNGSVAAGDTVYISGGSSGKTYSGNWQPKNGSSGNPITYTSGIDSGTTGTITLGSIGNRSTVMTGITVQGNANSRIVISINNGDAIAGNAGSSYDTFNYITLYGTIYINNSTFMNFGYITGDFYSGIDSAIYGVGNSGSGYGGSSFHDSTLYVRYSSGGIGDDCFKWVGHMDIYNNKILGVHDAGYPGSQHQDGIQTYVANMRIYNNYWENLQNYPIYGDSLLGAAITAWRIYNNTFNQWNTTGSQAVSLGCDGAACNGTDIIVSNNTIVNSAACIWLNQGTSGGSWSGNYVVNNICYNGGNITTTNAGATVSNNTTATTNINFVSYGSSMSYPSLDLHLQSSSTAVIGQGISPSYLTSLYTTDKDGNTRTGTWDIGAYEYTSGAPLSGAARGATGRGAWRH
jgi:hypothetical protein